jgi:hypothetical protein
LRESCRLVVGGGKSGRRRERAERASVRAAAPTARDIENAPLDDARGLARRVVHEVREEGEHERLSVHRLLGEERGRGRGACEREGEEEGDEGALSLSLLFFLRRKLTSVLYVWYENRGRRVRR